MKFGFSFITAVAALSMTVLADSKSTVTPAPAAPSASASTAVYDSTITSTIYVTSTRWGSNPPKSDAAKQAVSTKAPDAAVVTSIPASGNLTTSYQPSTFSFSLTTPITSYLSASSTPVAPTGSSTSGSDADEKAAVKFAQVSASFQAVESAQPTPESTASPKSTPSPTKTGSGSFVSNGIEYVTVTAAPTYVTVSHVVTATNVITTFVVEE